MNTNEAHMAVLQRQLDKERYGYFYNLFCFRCRGFLVQVMRKREELMSLSTWSVECKICRDHRVISSEFHETRRYLNV